ncbi:MAG: [Fe-Fe] hydrogenase large subunit C-terminal domain-containing protein [Eubacteriales bacterium]
MKEYYHSVVLDKAKCKGCTTCIRNCPTQAIRVRNGKALIIEEKCIDCGECIRVCPHNAKNAITDPLDSIKQYAYSVALPAPTLVGQFNANFTVNEILTAIKNIGFDEVIEVAYGAEIVGKALKWEIETEAYLNIKPIISSACPAVVRLIQVRYPELIPHILKLESPMEVTARITKKRLIEEKGLKEEDVGIFFITPCAAKATTIHSQTPWEQHQSSVNASISIKDIYPKILDNLKKMDTVENLRIASGKGLMWADSGGEGSYISHKNIINVDGIQNVISVLEEIERGRLENIEYFEGLACIGGCVGGCLTIENTFLAKKRIADRAMDHVELSISQDQIKEYYHSGLLSGHDKILPRPSPPLDADMQKAIEKMTKIDNIERTLPGVDCGSCGAPGCRALAEDIVRGRASEVDCIFVLREAIGELSKLMYDLSEKLVPVMHDKNGEETDDS